MTMTRRQRIHTALAGGVPDRPPIAFDSCGDALRDVFRHYGAEDKNDLYDKAGIDGFSVWEWNAIKRHSTRKGKKEVDIERQAKLLTLQQSMDAQVANRSQSARKREARRKRRKDDRAEFTGEIKEKKPKKKAEEEKPKEKKEIDWSKIKPAGKRKRKSY